MKIKRAILTGVIIWIIAISFYTLSSIYASEYVENLSNIVLFIVVMPLVWLGSSYYYKKDKKTHGYVVGQTMLLTAVALDVLITVPFFILPNGGSYNSFFTSLEFWIIAFEFLSVAVLYWYIRIYPKIKNIRL